MWFDGHIDVLWRLWQGRPLDSLDASLARQRAGGVRAAVYAVFLPPSVPVTERSAAARRQLDLFQKVIMSSKVYPVHQIRTGADLALTSVERPGAMLEIEGVECMQGNLDALDWLYAAGVRQIGLTWNLQNEAGSGRAVEPDGGLTAWGRELLKRMQVRQPHGQWVLDLAHAGPQTFTDALAASPLQYPVLVSHTACRKFVDIPRNLSDSQLKALFARGSLVGMTLVPEFLNPTGLATGEDVLKHVDHIVSLGGERHLFFGTDFDGTDTKVQGFEHANALPELARLLSTRYTAAQVKAFLWENAATWYRHALG